MPIEQTQRACAACRRPTLHARPAPNHLVHAIVTFFMCGLWLPVWFLASQRGPWRCQTCGARSVDGGGGFRVLQAVGILVVVVGVAVAIASAFGFIGVPTP